MFYIILGTHSLSGLETTTSCFSNHFVLQCSVWCLWLEMLLTEKALVEHAYELRSELENVAAYVSSLFSKIGWYLFLPLTFDLLDRGAIILVRWNFNYE